MACGYNISGVRRLLVTDHSNVAVKDFSAEVSSAIAVDTKSVEFEGGSELDNTYAYGKKLTVTVNGLSVPLLSGKRFIIEDNCGDCFLIDEEFDSSLTWRFTLDKNEEVTVWDFEIPSNLQITPCVVSSVDLSALSSCGYDSTFKPYVMTSPKAATLLNMNGTYLAEYKDRLEGEVTLTVSWDGVKYENRLQITQPLTEDNVGYSDMIQRFVLYRHTFAVRSSSGWYVGGYEHGAEVQVDIATDSSETGSVTITLTEICDSPCMFFASLSFAGGEQLFYDYVKYAHDGTKGFVCTGDGEALYILQRGYYQDGTATKLYKAKSGYANRFRNLEITGLFYSTKMFENSDCFSSDVLTTTFPSNISIDMRSLSGSVYSENSEWEVQYKPSWVTLTPDHGDSGTTNVVITFTSAAATTDRIVLTNNSETQVLTVTNNTGSMTITPETHDASAYTVEITSTGKEPTLSPPSGITTKKVGRGHWTADIPANTDITEKQRTWRFTQSGNAIILTSVQSGCSVRWTNTGSYICDNGDSYEKQAKFVSFDGGQTWTPTGDFRKGDLIEAGASYCSV